jgi:hypothetical protein
LPEDVVKDSQVRDNPIRGDRGDRGDRDKMEPKIAREGGRSPPHGAGAIVASTHLVAMSFMAAGGRGEGQPGEGQTSPRSPRRW